MNNPKALYIHIPFCDHICSYCDFYKLIAKKEIIDKYVKYLEKDLLKYKEYLKYINSIYIGGGTPSSIGIENLQYLFKFLHKHIDFQNIVEFSIECNPKDINEEIIKLFKKFGVNRISLGIQSTNNQKLKFLRRNHTKKDVINCLKILNNSKFTNYNADILYGLPNDSFSKIKKDIKLIKKYKATHFSCYSLILEEKTILYNKWQKNEFKLFDEEKESKIYYKIQKYLEKNGYMQYEISNYSKENFECLYNLNTWNNDHYLGIGASASYYINNKRFTNVKNLNDYFDFIDNKTVNYYEVEDESSEEKIYEEIILSLRKTSGINTNNFFNKYNYNIFDLFPNINFLIKNGLLVFKNNNLFIPKDKFYVSNYIINRIFE